MTDHPITPPPMWVASLRNSAPHGIRDAGVTREIWLIHNAFAAGADQELEACCANIYEVYGKSAYGKRRADWLRSARRPKPLSLKEQALEILGYPKDFWSEDEVDTIRRALEQLDD